MDSNLRAAGGTTMTRNATRVLCAAAMWAGAGSAVAQGIRGTVVQADSSTRAPGVIVVATDPLGAVVARTLSSDVGDFDVRVPGPGRYALDLDLGSVRPRRP